MKKTLLVAILVTTLSGYAQIGIGTATPATSSILDLTSATKGFLLPRMTNAQKYAILSPEAGLVVWCTDCGSAGLMQMFNGVAWTNMSGVVTHTPSSNGSAVISAIACNTASAGTMTVGTAVSGVTQTITATVTTVGTYNFSTTANGVTFSASGTFAATGNQDIVLTATGTPIASGNFNYSLNSTPSCTFVKTVEAQIINITSTTGKIWMDRNLGATRVAQSKDDYLAYGNLYQWGRGSDGHELMNWTSTTSGTPVNGTTTTLSTTDTPVDNLFILKNSGLYDWRVTQNNNLWQGLTGINNPCPVGYRLPTNTEFAAEVAAYNITNSTNAFTSPLKYTIPGYRNLSGMIVNTGINGFYWCSTVSGIRATHCFFGNSSASIIDIYRAYGLSLRCIKN